MRGGIEVVHDLEAQRLLGPVHGGDVEKQIERMNRLEALDRGHQLVRCDLVHQHTMRFTHPSIAQRKFLLQHVEDGRGHDQNLSLMMWCLPAAMISCNFIMPSMTISGRGGQPGM